MPGLCITLGIFDRLFDLLEEACQQLDIQQAERGRQADTLYSFKLYLAAVQNIKEHEGEEKREDEEASAAEQLSTSLTVRGANTQQVEFADNQQLSYGEKQQHWLVITFLYLSKQFIISTQKYMIQESKIQKKNRQQYVKVLLQWKGHLLRLWIMLQRGAKRLPWWYICRKPCPPITQGTTI